MTANPATKRPDRHHLEQCGMCHAATGRPCVGLDGDHAGRRWQICITAPRLYDGSTFGDDTLVPDGGRCRPTIESTYVWDHCRRDPRFPYESVSEAIAYRGACLGCGWAGPARLDENQAVEDAHDHAWPGWRALPIVPRQPNDPKPHDLQRWRNQLAAVYQACGIDVGRWTQDDAPFRTARTVGGTRSHNTWRGGYDICGAVTAAGTQAATPKPDTTQLALW